MANLRGRPPLTCNVMQIRLTLSLREDRDQDLILFFRDIPERKRALAVKVALRSGGVMIEPEGESVDDDVDSFDNFLFG
jgi:hypothetical protein